MQNGNEIEYFIVVMVIFILCYDATCCHQRSKKAYISYSVFNTLFNRRSNENLWNWKL